MREFVYIIIHGFISLILFMVAVVAFHYLDDEKKGPYMKVLIFIIYIFMMLLYLCCNREA